MADVGHHIEPMTLEDLEKRRHPRNPKTHAVAQLAESVVRFGFAAPILLCERTGMIAAGHGRLEAVRSIEFGGKDRPAGVGTNADREWTVPVVRGWSSADDTELMAYIVADNQHTMLGGWDDAALARALGEITEAADLTGVGFGVGDFRDLLDSLRPPVDAKTDPDAVPETPAEPITQSGDMWLLGGHTTCPGCGHKNPVGG